MVSISHERPVESERRLRDVLRAAEVVHLEGAWCFRRLPGGPPPAEAIAAVRDRDGWCALVPAASGAAGPETCAVTSITFSPAIENSGFVGWLATDIKRRLGSGVFVVCGDNPARGGIFDYLGYPSEVAGAVRDLIERLRDRQSDADADPLGLDLRVFRVAETSPASAISSDTIFEIRERGGVVEATCAGGQVVTGFLTGRRVGDRIDTAYVQLHVDGELRTGSGAMRVERLPDGGLRLVEDYTWSDGTPGRNVLESRPRAGAGSRGG